MATHVAHGREEKKKDIEGKGTLKSLWMSRMAVSRTLWHKGPR